MVLEHYLWASMDQLLLAFSSDNEIASKIPFSNYGEHFSSTYRKSSIKPPSLTSPPPLAVRLCNKPPPLY